MKRGYRKGRFTKTNASRPGKLGAEVRERRGLERIASGGSASEPRRVPEGASLGALTWHAQDGTVRRWMIRQGPRSNNITVIARVAHVDTEPRSMGRDKLLTKLRKHLAIPKRLMQPCL